MARIFLRVPDYIGAYLRNRKPGTHIPVGGDVSFPENSTVFFLIAGALRDNPDGEFFGTDCFSENQFRNLREKVGGRYPSDEDIMNLTSTVRKVKEKGEYVSISLPREVEFGEYRKAPSSSWTLYDSSIPRIKKEMNRMFWRDFFSYMEKEKDFALAHGTDRTVMEGIERFMERYDIPNQSGNGMKKNLKRNYYRKLEQSSFSEDEYVEHGNK